jgi:ribosomal protein L3
MKIDNQKIKKICCQNNFSFKEFNSYFKLNFKVDSVFAQNEMIDVLGVTKGKGF